MKRINKKILSLGILGILFGISQSVFASSSCNLYSKCNNDGKTITINNNCEIKKEADCRNNNVIIKGNVMLKDNKNIYMELNKNNLKTKNNGKVVIKKGSGIKKGFLNPKILDAKVSGDNKTITKTVTQPDIIFYGT